MGGLLLVALAAAAEATGALYQYGSNVVSLSPEDFDRTVLHSNHVWFVEFYNPG